MTVYKDGHYSSLNVEFSSIQLYLYLYLYNTESQHRFCQDSLYSKAKTLQERNPTVSTTSKHLATVERTEISSSDQGPAGPEAASQTEVSNRDVHCRCLYPMSKHRVAKCSNHTTKQSPHAIVYVTVHLCVSMSTHDSSRDTNQSAFRGKNCELAYIMASKQPWLSGEKIWSLNPWNRHDDDLCSGLQNQMQS